MTTALILDCDGVLADTELDGHLVAFNQVFAERGFPFRWSEETYGELLAVGGGKERLRAYLTKNPDRIPGSEDLDTLLAEVHARKSEVYQDIINSGSIHGRPGVRRLVEEALGAGWLVAVASTSATPSVEAVARSVLGQENRRRMAGIFAGDTVQHKKPAPDIYLLAIREMGIRPNQAVAIEDSSVGARAAAAAQIPHIVTLSHFTRDESFPDAVCIVDNLGEPDRPAVLHHGLDIRDDRQVIGVESLERVISPSK